MKLSAVKLFLKTYYFDFSLLYEIKRYIIERVIDHKTLKISRKIFKVVTDNGSNVKKAFKELNKINKEYDTCDDTSDSDSDNTDEISTDSSNSITNDQRNKITVLITGEMINLLLEDVEKVNSIERFGYAGHNIQLNESMDDKSLQTILKKISKFIAKTKKSNLISEEKSTNFSTKITKPGGTQHRL